MTRITVASGDGIGPEIMEATLSILRAAGAELEYDHIDIGEKVYKAGHSSGISPSDWEIIRRNRIFLKAPITTPQGGGWKSLNVTLRKTLGLYSNVRPCTCLHPFVGTRHPQMDVVVIRENEEDLYAGIEHQQTDEVVQCLKLISRPGCEKIIRYAFEYARQQNRKRVSCFTKDNIMKQTDGLFHRVFDEIAAEYPDIKSDHWIIDIGTARLADTPEEFDVIVTPNLYGDVISDVAAQISGSVGLAGSANIGESFAMFEAIHGSAPDIAGKNVANPSGLLQGAIMMLNHLGQTQVAEKIQNAWLRTIEERVHTFDLFEETNGGSLVGTREFAAVVVANLGMKPALLRPANFGNKGPLKLPVYKRKPKKKKDLLGVDLFVQWSEANPEQLAGMVGGISMPGLELSMITNRGIKVWPNGFPETFCTDHWRCRFKAADGAPVAKTAVVELMSRALQQDIDVIKSENLYAFDGQPAFSAGQGQ